jgi:pyrroline-5-carboxylate reductase
MGEAILGAALEQGVFRQEDVTVIEKIEARRDLLYTDYGIHVSDSFEAMEDAGLVILSVKPQEMQSVSGRLRPDAVLLSIMAGVTVASLRTEFAHDRIVRVMPNTPAAIKMGMSGWTATEPVSAEQKDYVQRLLSAIGREIYFEDEKKLDMVTAVSGSGPAYVFLFIEALTEGAVAVGLPRAVAEELVTQTVYGAAAYLRETGRGAPELRAAVTSPAGTTAAGILELEKGAFRATVIECIRAAHARAKELGQA